MRKHTFWISLLVLVMGITACKSVPMTGRKSMTIYPSSEINAMSFSQYQEVLDQSTLSTNVEQTEMVRRVGTRIQHAVEKYLRENGHESAISGFQWEFNLIEGEQVNAWCMPGGKVAFYTGIIPVCQTEEGIAVVMGHEIAHAIAEHGNERMSQGMMQQMGGQALSVAMSEQSEKTQMIAGQAFGLGSHYGAILPFSRLHESEADEMGLYFMAMAGYNPNEATAFWGRMSKMGGEGPPEFLSTHPAPQTRINDLNANMSKAMEYYEASKK